MDNQASNEMLAKEQLTPNSSRNVITGKEAKATGTGNKDDEPQYDGQVKEVEL